MQQTNNIGKAIGRIGEAVYDRIMSNEEEVYSGALGAEETAATDILRDAEYPVSVDGINPHNREHVSEEVDPETAIDTFLEAEKELLSDPSYVHRAVITHDRGNLNFEIGQTTSPEPEDSGPALDFLTYEGTLDTGVEREEIEDTLEEYGIDRYTEGWHLDQSLEEF